jgi:hypothetical protein
MTLTVPMKLGVFAAVLAVLFGAATLAGGAIHPLRANVSASSDQMMGADAMGVRGLAVSDDQFTLHLARHSAQPGKRFELAFRITDNRGAIVKDFDVEHTKRMHFIVVRRDMTDFQHVHPVESPDGTWRVPLTLHEPGSYRVFADFAIAGTPHTLADDLSTNGTVTWHSLPRPSRVATIDGFKVQLTEGPTQAGKESSLNFVVTRVGQPIHTQNYLGAKGHLVALRQGDLAFLHVHPAPDTLDFEAAFPSAGAYRLFLQFKVAGQVHTAEFTQEVSQ